MSRSMLRCVGGLLTALTLWVPIPAAAQSPRPSGSPMPVEGAIQVEDGPDHSLPGTFIGIASGVALGLGMASMTDYALEEGGLFVVTVVGGGLGGFIGHKVGSAVGRPWHDPGDLQVSVRYAYTTSAASRAIGAAFAEAGLSAANEHHPIAPSLTATYRLGSVNAGFEFSGLGAQWFRSRQAGIAVIESLGGWSTGLIATYSSLPLESRRWTYSVGGGVDHYHVSVLSYIDPIAPGYPPEQPDRSASVDHNMMGAQFRAGFEVYVVPNVSVQISGVGRFTGAVDVPGVSIVHPRPELTKTLPAHSIEMSSVHLQLGIGLRF